jgi:hypothetical protein
MWYLVNLPGNKLNVAVRTEKNSIAADCLNKVSVVQEKPANRAKAPPERCGFILRTLTFSRNHEFRAISKCKSKNFTIKTSEKELGLLCT